MILCPLRFDIHVLLLKIKAIYEVKIYEVMIFNPRRKMERVKKTALVSFLLDFPKQFVNMFNEMKAEFIHECRVKK